MINWSEFTPWSALAGGMVIGIATALFLLFNGRIAGISGIVGGLFRLQKGDTSWRIAFVAGLIPLMFASGAGAIGNKTIGTAAAGGMLFGTLFGVIVIPGLYVIFAGIGMVKRKKITKKNIEEAYV